MINKYGDQLSMDIYHWSDNVVYGSSYPEYPHLWYMVSDSNYDNRITPAYSTTYNFARYGQGSIYNATIDNNLVQIMYSKINFKNNIILTNTQNDQQNITLNCDSFTGNLIDVSSGNLYGCASGSVNLGVLDAYDVRYYTEYKTLTERDIFPQNYLSENLTGSGTIWYNSSNITEKHIDSNRTDNVTNLTTTFNVYSCSIQTLRYVSHTGAFNKTYNSQEFSCSETGGQPQVTLILPVVEPGLGSNVITISYLPTGSSGGGSIIPTNTTNSTTNQTTQINQSGNSIGDVVQKLTDAVVNVVKNGVQNASNSDIYIIGIGIFILIVGLSLGKGGGPVRSILIVAALISLLTISSVATVSAVSWSTPQQSITNDNYCYANGTNSSGAWCRSYFDSMDFSTGRKFVLFDGIDTYTLGNDVDFVDFRGSTIDVTANGIYSFKFGGLSNDFFVNLVSQNGANITTNQIVARNICYANGTNSSGQWCQSTIAGTPIYPWAFYNDSGIAGLSYYDNNIASNVTPILINDDLSSIIFGDLGYENYLQGSIVSLSGQGVVTFDSDGTQNRFYKNLNSLYSANITSYYFKGNGSLLTGICLTNTTGCPTSSGSMNYSNIALTNKTNTFTEIQQIEQYKTFLPKNPNFTAFVNYSLNAGDTLLYTVPAGKILNPQGALYFYNTMAGGIVVNMTVIINGTRHVILPVTTINGNTRITTNVGSAPFLLEGDKLYISTTAQNLSLQAYIVEIYDVDDNIHFINTNWCNVTNQSIYTVPSGKKAFMTSIVNYGTVFSPFSNSALLFTNRTLNYEMYRVNSGDTPRKVNQIASGSTTINFTANALVMNTAPMNANDSIYFSCNNLIVNNQTLLQTRFWEYTP
jgi:hypothetical protein